MTTLWSDERISREFDARVWRQVKPNGAEAQRMCLEIRNDYEAELAKLRAEVTRLQVVAGWQPVQPDGERILFDKPFKTFVGVPRPGLLAIVKVPEGNVTLIEHGDNYAFCKRQEVTE